MHLEVGRSSCDKSVQRYVSLSARKGHKINGYILKPTCSKLINYGISKYGKWYKQTQSQDNAV